MYREGRTCLEFSVVVPNPSLFIFLQPVIKTSLEIALGRLFSMFFDRFPFGFGLSSNVRLTESQMETHSDFLHHAVLAVK